MLMKLSKSQKKDKKTKKTRTKTAKKSLFCTIIAVNNRLKNTKQITLTNCKLAIFDEYIIDPDKGERYLNNEMFSIKTICDTIRKKNPTMKFIALGNPYSRYSPFVAEFNVNTNKMLPNTFQKGSNWVGLVPSRHYKQELMARNGEYEGQDDYIKWALGGIH